MAPSRALTAACSAELSYAQVGSTAATLPTGYRQVRRARELGTGIERFRAAAELLMTWQVHRAAGLHVESTAPEAQVGAVVVLGVGVGPLRGGRRSGSSSSRTSRDAAGSRTAPCKDIPRAARNCSR